MSDHPDPRILFAAERTLLAWIRTGIAIMAFGFVVMRFGTHRGAIIAGSVLALLGAGLNLVGAIEYRQIMRRLRSGDHALPERPIQIAVGVAVVLALVGVGGMIYLVLIRF